MIVPKTLAEIQKVVDIFRASGRLSIPVPIDQWKAMQMARLAKGSVAIKTDKATGKKKVAVVDKTPAPLRRGKALAADRTEAKLRGNAARSKAPRAPAAPKVAKKKAKG